MRETHTARQYYDQTLHIAQATGAGLIYFMQQDHLSPPLRNEDYFAQDSQKWREAVNGRVINLAHQMHIQPRQKVLDLGCGIGGPGRDITAEFKCNVIGISLSTQQLLNLRRISTEKSSPYTQVITADMQQLPLNTGEFDHAFSINALYHVPNPDKVLSEIHRVLRPKGVFGIDDWFTTRQTTPDTLNQLRYNWSTGTNGFHNIDTIMHLVGQRGFKVTQTNDFTQEAGAFLSEERFGATYDAQIAPILIDIFPLLYQYDAYEPSHAQQAVAQLRSDILYMGQLYRNGQATYRQIIGVKQ